MTSRRVVVQSLLAAAAAPSLPSPAFATASSPLDEHDALGLADLVRRREVSPAELLDRALARLDAVRSLNAVPLLHEAEARAQIAAGVGTGPFAGVPLLLKDLWVGLAGTPTTAGSRLFANDVAAVDSEIVTRFKRAGFVIFGKTASPELGLTGTTESVLHGLTRNPWDLERTAGGSSGGAAAVVAARVLPVAHASDGAGSIRTPASCCGVFGLKPSRGRVPLGPGRLEGWNGCSTQLAVSLTVRDMAALLDAVSGPETGATVVAPPPTSPWLSTLERPPSRLRIALVTRPTAGSPVDPAVVAATLDAARLCESLGHVVEEAALPIDHAATNAGMLATLTSQTWNALEARGRELGRKVRSVDVEPVTWRLARLGRRVSALDYARAREAFDAAGVAMAAFHRTYDVVLSPTIAKLPVPLGVLSLSPRDFGEYVREVTTFGPFAALSNMTGQPAMSVPLAWHDGLPIGVMFAARFGDEDTLLRLARQFEQARQWRDRRPPVSARG